MEVSSVWTNFRSYSTVGVAFGVLALVSPRVFAQSCTQTLSSGANVGSAITSAAAGSMICLSNGSYGGFTLSGVSKSPRVTVAAVNPLGASFSGTIAITGNTNGLTFDGFDFGPITITGTSTRDLTFRNFNGRNKISIDGVTVSPTNILLENFAQTDLDVADANPAGIYLDGSRSTPIVTIRGATIDGGCADGIQSGTSFILEDSRVMNKQVGSCPNDPHTDGVQFYGGPYVGTIVRRNYFYNNIQVLAAYDGVDHVLIENNVFDPGANASSSHSRPCQIEMYSDDSSIIRHNTVLYRGNGFGEICIDRKSADDAGFGTIVVDNIANLISTRNGSTIAQRNNNLLRSGATASEISGAPTYLGGATPTTLQGFVLAPGSLGKGAASSPAGSDIGADISGATGLTPNPPTTLTAN
jgi:hypothetical protein